MPPAFPQQPIHEGGNCVRETRLDCISCNVATSIRPGNGQNNDSRKRRTGRELLKRHIRRLSANGIAGHFRFECRIYCYLNLSDGTKTLRKIDQLGALVLKNLANVLVKNDV